MERTAFSGEETGLSSLLIGIHKGNAFYHHGRALDTVSLLLSAVLFWRHYFSETQAAGFSEGIVHFCET